MAGPAKSRHEVVERIAALRPAIRSLGIRRVAIFGSFARNQAGVDSDVDVLVEFEAGRKNFDAWLDLGDLLERTLGRRVDLVSIDGLSPFVGPRILAEALDVVRVA
jgi:predicted nucleotidyltransferase